MSWNDLGPWWLREVSDDPAYEDIVTPLLLDVLRPLSGMTYLDLGAGEGRVQRAVEAHGGVVYGIDVSEWLARKTPDGRMLVARLPDLPVVGSSVDGAYAVLVLEHLEDHHAFFSETARVTRETGVLAVVSNHPVWTAPGSTPITDEDGEVLWRPGSYFSNGHSDMPAGRGRVRFHHRTMASLLNAAARAGWLLEEMVERSHHELEDQAGIPRLVGLRWRRGRILPLDSHPAST